MDLETLSGGDFQVPRRHLVMLDDCSPEEWAEFGERLRQVGENWHWAVGDWLVTGLDRWGESRYAAAERITRLSNQTLRHLVHVARRFPQGQRHGTTFSAHAEVASLERDVAHEILATAEKDSLSVRAVRRRANLARGNQPDDDDDGPNMPGASLPIRRPATSPMMPGRSVKTYEARPISHMGQAIIASLKTRRQALGISQAELDERTGWGPGQASHYEAHDRNPTLAALEEWCQALGAELVVMPAKAAAA